MALRLRDKFGDQGIAAVLLAAPVDREKVAVDSFLISCRALGRGVEDALWSAMRAWLFQHCLHVHSGMTARRQVN